MMDYTTWRLTHPPIMGADDDPAPADPPAPEVAAPAPEPAAAPAETLDGPWAKDLVDNFTDPAVRAQVDTFLRGRVQPYTTQLETQLKGLEGAQELLRDLQNNPGETYLALTQELFGEELTPQIRDVLNAAVNPEQQQAPPQDGVPQADQPLDPRVQNLLDRFEQQETNEAYDREVAALVEQDPEIVPDLFHPFVVASNGDLVEAAGNYHHWVAQVREAGGTIDGAPAAPEVLGGDVAGAATPPIQPDYKNLDEAMDAFFAEIKPSGAPPVGAV